MWLKVKRSGLALIPFTDEYCKRPDNKVRPLLWMTSDALYCQCTRCALFAMNPADATEAAVIETGDFGLFCVAEA